MDRAAETADHELKTARPATQAETENFFAAGGIGEPPGISSMRLAELQENAIRTRRASDTARVVAADLDRQVEAIAKELAANCAAIESHGGNLRRTG